MATPSSRIFLTEPHTLAAARICNHFYPIIMYNFNQLFKAIVPDHAPKDGAKLLSRILDALNRSREHPYFLSRAMICIRGHTNTLRHYTSKLRISHLSITQCIEALISTMVALNLWTNRSPLVSTYFESIHNFYGEYHTFAYTTLGIGGLLPKEVFVLNQPSISVQIASGPSLVAESSSGPPLKLDPNVVPWSPESSLDPSRPQPCPQGQTVKWYKDHGFTKFLTHKIWVPRDGPLIGVKYLFVSHKGTMVALRYGPHLENFKYMKTTIPIDWYPFSHHWCHGTDDEEGKNTFLPSPEASHSCRCYNTDRNGNPKDEEGPI